MRLKIMNGLYFTLEQKFGHLGVPGLVRIVAFFRLIVWVLSLANPEFQQVLGFDGAKILKGEVWRIASFMLVSGVGTGMFGPFYILIEVMFLFFIGDLLEQAWGPFGVTFYMFGAVIGGAMVGVVIQPASVVSEPVTASLIMAAACLYPSVEVLLFLIIPVKLKWIGLIAAGGLMYILLMSMNAWGAVALFFVGIPMAAMLLPFVLVFVPALLQAARQQSENAVRRSRFEQSKLPETETFHRCGNCNITEVSHPDREFRIAANGEEYCSECKPPES